MKFRFASLLVLFSLAFAGGCSPYVGDVYYSPHPAVAEIQAATTQPSQAVRPPVTTYATVIGVRREDRDAHLPLSVEIRMRLDNHGQQPISFDPHSLELTNGSLVRFPPPIVEPVQPISIPQGQSMTVQANFPFPPGINNDGGIETLQLRWTVQIDGQVVPQTAAFHRVHRYYYDPYWDYPPYPYGYPYFDVGGAIVIRR